MLEKLHAKQLQQLERRHRKQLEEESKRAAKRLAEIAEYLRERGCYDTVDRVLVEAEALARRAEPEEIAYYQCLIRCLRSRCRVEECLQDLGLHPASTSGEKRD